jgi:hypothetical protein
MVAAITIEITRDKPCRGGATLLLVLSIRSDIRGKFMTNPTYCVTRKKASYWWRVRKKRTPV